VRFWLTGRGPSQDVIAFTCGHTYGRREYFEQILPELRRRLDSLPAPAPLTASVRPSPTITSSARRKRTHTDTQARTRAWTDTCAQLWLASYYLPRMPLACPLCAFNGLRQDLVRAQPDAADRVRAWDR
jgi:hypothetical protein